MSKFLPKHEPGSKGHMAAQIARLQEYNINLQVNLSAMAAMYPGGLPQELLTALGALLKSQQWDNDRAITKAVFEFTTQWKAEQDTKTLDVGVSDGPVDNA